MHLPKETIGVVSELLPGMSPFAGIWRRNSQTVDPASSPQPLDAQSTDKAPAVLPASSESHSSEEKSYFKERDKTIVQDVDQTSPGELTLEEGMSRILYR